MDFESDYDNLETPIWTYKPSDNPMNGLVIVTNQLIDNKEEFKDQELSIPLTPVDIKKEFTMKVWRDQTKKKSTQYASDEVAEKVTKKESPSSSDKSSKHKTAKDAENQEEIIVSFLSIGSEELKERIDNTAHVKNCIERKDVVIKSILRCMRKYYADLIQDNTDFDRKARNIKLKHQKLVNSAIIITRKLSLDGHTDIIAFYLLAFSFPIDFKKLLTLKLKMLDSDKALFSTALEALKGVETALSKYSKKVMHEFQNIPEACLLLQHYLTRVRNYKYQNYYKKLKKLSADGVSNNPHKATDPTDRFESKVIRLIK